jgi:hypothetical protein
MTPAIERPMGDKDEAGMRGDSWFLGAGRAPLAGDPEVASEAAKEQSALATIAHVCHNVNSGLGRAAKALDEPVPW